MSTERPAFCERRAPPEILPETEQTMSEHETVPADIDLTSEDTASHEEPGDQAREHAAGCEQEKLVPVSESKRYRKRAQAAETTLADLQRELQAKDAVLQEQQELISELRRRQQIDERLIESNASDLETARLLTELAIKEMNEPDVEQAVEELRRRKPFLFLRAPAGSGALSPRETTGPAREQHLARAACEASESGRRQDLLRYLRLRRQK